MESKLLQCLNDFVNYHQVKLVSEADEIHFYLNTFWFAKFNQEFRKENPAINDLIKDNGNFDSYTYNLMGTKIFFWKESNGYNRKTEDFFNFLINGYN